MIPIDMNDKYSISYFDRIDNPGGAKRANLTINTLFDAITRIRPQKAKKESPAWSPCIFNGRANNKNAIEVSCVVWDIDEGNISFDEMQKQLEQTVYNCFMHTTHSHTPKKHKYRVIIPLETPIVAEDWQYCWIASLLKFKWMKTSYVDRACRDARRLYFLGGYSKQDYRTYSQLDRLNWDAQSLTFEVYDREEKARKQRKAKMDREYREYIVNQSKKRGMHRDWYEERRNALRSDIGERRKFAALMSSFGGHIVSGSQKETGVTLDRVVGFPCPKCHKTDCTYFYIDPSIFTAAYCQHRNHCRWFGSLWDLAQHFGIGV